MAETTTQPEDRKTVVAFVVGLLIGGLLVWAFSAPDEQPRDNDREDERTEEAADDNNDDDEATTENETTPTGTTTPAPTLSVGEGNVALADTAAGTRVALGDVTYPVEEGWIGVRNYQDGRLGYLLGVVRFSEEQGLVPDEIVLQTPTRAGAQYAVVMYTDDGDRQFNLAADTQIDKIFATFTAE